MLLGSIEAGGTKFICAVGNKKYETIDCERIPTTTPDETLEKAVKYFKQFKDLESISISSFGPIELRKDAKKYGYITETPKIGWSDVNFLGTMKQHFDLPIYWTTDVNGSVYGEYINLKKQNSKINSIVYYTVGTGVGAGIIFNGKFLGDLGHPEMGHIKLKRHPDDLDFDGICPYHKDCLEGLVSGPTFEARLGKKGFEVPITNHVWDIMAYYVAQAALQATLTIRPNCIIFGGGVVNEKFLDKIRFEFTKMMNGYVNVGNVNKYIRKPSISENGSATIGNFALAKSLLS
ncbi:fructokinase [Apilactobacillus ozensis DSM 23829 = JCM 17196]|uniref:Fructokinase n=1 Tax=Apilactobacillus ozensis DSM 23829 = JCM 17196 TaxID=1423781 RepID=A0A0R2B162_9LACO|nr:fructokinase ScrK [Apilactobacillus ozensis]KRM69075.1 fructokinase [Apilactobacillus ozensis DSM 23829 = JCM 17196]